MTNTQTATISIDEVAIWETYKCPLEFTPDLRCLIDKIIRENKVTYKQYKIKKSSGGYRTISAPNDELKGAQRELLSFINSMYNPKCFLNKAATGFLKGMSIVANADKHRFSRGVLTPGRSKIKRVMGAKYVFSDLDDKSLGHKEIKASGGPKSGLKMDLKDAFGSIDSEALRIGLKTCFEMSDYDIDRVLKLCLYQGSLPQGAPTSPLMLNIALKPFDEYLNGVLINKVAIRYNCSIKYTRFADDMVFTCSDPVKLRTAIPIIYSVAKYFELRINKKKTRLMHKGTGIFVTGINIVNGLSHFCVSRRYRDRIKAAIHEASFLNKNSEKFQKLRDNIKGRISYVASVDSVHGDKLLLLAARKGVLDLNEKYAKIQIKDRQCITYLEKINRFEVFTANRQTSTRKRKNYEFDF